MSSILLLALKKDVQVINLICVLLKFRVAHFYSILTNTLHYMIRIDL